MSLGNISFQRHFEDDELTALDDVQVPTKAADLPLLPRLLLPANLFSTILAVIDVYTILPWARSHTAELDLARAS